MEKKEIELTTKDGRKIKVNGICRVKTENENISYIIYEKDNEYYAARCEAENDVVHFNTTITEEEINGLNKILEKMENENALY